jgi:DNA modification methylase
VGEGNGVDVAGPDGLGVLVAVAVRKGVSNPTPAIVGEGDAILVGEELQALRETPIVVINNILSHVTGGMFEIITANSKIQDLVQLKQGIPMGKKANTELSGQDLSNSESQDGRPVIADTDELSHYQMQDLTNKVILGDSLNVLKKLPDACADLIFFDPPYFLQLPKKKLIRWNVHTTVDAVNDEWDRFGSFAEYDAFIELNLIQLKRLMKPTATIWAIATYHSLFRIGRIMQDLGFWILNDVLWLKTNPMPNWLGVRFTNATETLIWAVREKGTKGYTFHKEFARDVGVGSVGANVWVIPTCTGQERIRDKDGRKVHSTQKPVELLRRVILSASNPGDLVLDPAAGVGTTGFVAKTHGRQFLMVEKNPIYVAAIEERMMKPAANVPASHNRKDGHKSLPSLNGYAKLKK